MKLFISCTLHGEDLPWEGHLICSAEEGGCGEVYQVSDETAPRFAPEHCACGKVLVPIPGMNRVDFTARPLCLACYPKIVAWREGRTVKRGTFARFA